MLNHVAIWGLFVVYFVINFIAALVPQVGLLPCLPIGLSCPLQMTSYRLIFVLVGDTVFWLRIIVRLASFAHSLDLTCC